MSEQKYIYEQTDKDDFENHKQEQFKVNVGFQNSFRETCRVVAFNEVIDMIDEGKTVIEIKEFLVKRNHDVLSD